VSHPRSRLSVDRELAPANKEGNGSATRDARPLLTWVGRPQTGASWGELRVSREQPRPSSTDGLESSTIPIRAATVAPVLSGWAQEGLIMTSSLSAFELIADVHATLGEGPVWDEAEGAVVWVDILAGLVHLSDPDGRERRRYDVGIHVGAALPAYSGGWLIVTSDGFSLLANDGTVTRLLDVTAARPDLRFNDAACDPAGRAFAGTMRYDEASGDASLYRLDVDGSHFIATEVLSGLGLANGIGWSPDAAIMYFVDSLEHAIFAYNFDLESAEIGPRRCLIETSSLQGIPDGLCVDAEGGIWVAFYGGGTVRRYLPDGTLDAEITLPVAFPTCPAFGDPDLRTLFVTTARSVTDAGPGSGGIWASQPGVTGLPAVAWRGDRRAREDR